jgi:UPF0271 protein
MNAHKKSKIYILDTTAILSGKSIDLDDDKMVSTPGVSKELKPGGKDYRAFQFLIEKGLAIHIPSKESTSRINVTSGETGDKDRLSDADKEILALALDINKDDKKDAIILSDDYSIQNLAHVLNIRFENISQPGIIKKFKWVYQCSGCGKKFKENIKTCPICGAWTKNIVSHKENIEG